MSDQQDESDIEVVDIDDETVTDEDSDKTEGVNSAEEAERFKNEYLYLRAEFENHKKNAIKERSQLVKYGNERLILEILEVIDNFERALEVKPNSENLQSFEDGMKMIHAELLSSLSKFGVSSTDPTGQPFDPQEHDALSNEPTNDMDVGHVLRVFKKAYRLHDRLIRPAQVVVASELKEEES